MDAKKCYELARLKNIIHSTYGIKKDAYNISNNKKFKTLYKNYRKLYKEVAKEQQQNQNS